jgi:AraC-like DNA-binding protein
MLALQWMAQGASIQRVASGLGYDSAGSFVAMFRKTLGASPGCYMAQDARDRFARIADLMPTLRPPMNFFEPTPKRRPN